MTAFRAPDAAPAVEAAVGASLVSSLRGLLIERGHWDAVRARMLVVDPSSASWIETPAAAKWVPFERHALLMSSLRDVIGDDGMRELGRLRMRETLTGGMLAPLFRSWVRSYSSAPAQLLRVTPHAWRAATQGLGRLVVGETRGQEMDVRVVGAPDALRRADAWHRFLEGYGLGVLEVGELRGACTIRASDATIVVTFSWS